MHGLCGGMKRPTPARSKRGNPTVIQGYQLVRQKTPRAAAENFSGGLRKVSLPGSFQDYGGLETSSPLVLILLEF